VMQKLSSSGFAKVILAGLSGLVVASAGAQVSKHGDLYSFRMKFTKGQRIDYTMNMDGKVMGQKLLAKLPLSQVTTAVQGDIGTLTMTVGDPVMTISGRPFNRAMPSNVHTGTMQVDSKGHVLGGAQTQTSVVLPDKPVRIGGTWSAKSTVATQMAPSMDVVGTYKFVGLERVGGFNAARFSFVIKEVAPKKPKVSKTGKPEPKMAVTGKGTLWINAADCTMIKSSSDMSLTMGSLVTPMLITISRK
jgi:hypothetical protein